MIILHFNPFPGFIPWIFYGKAKEEARSLLFSYPKTRPEKRGRKKSRS